MKITLQVVALTLTVASASARATLPCGKVKDTSPSSTKEVSGGKFKNVVFGGEGSSTPRRPAPGSSSTST